MKKLTQQSKIIFSVLVLTISMGMTSVSHAYTGHEKFVGSIPLVSASGGVVRTHSDRSDYNENQKEVNWVKANLPGPRVNDHYNKSSYFMDK